jgi:hypothetical protein
MMILDTGAPIILFNGDVLQAKMDGGLDTVMRSDSAHNSTVRVSAAIHVANRKLVQTDYAIVSRYPAFQMIGRPLLGVLGTPAMFPYETIVDYQRHQLTFIPVDSVGHRQADIPAYTPQSSVTLEERGEEPWHEMFYVPTRIGDSLVTMLFDAGSPRNTLTHRTSQWAQAHLKTIGRETEWKEWLPGDMVRLDHLFIDRKRFDSLSFRVIDTTSKFFAKEADVLGTPFFEAAEIIGFNLRTKQLIFYK